MAKKWEMYSNYSHEEDPKIKNFLASIKLCFDKIKISQNRFDAIEHQFCKESEWGALLIPPN